MQSMFHSHQNDTVLSSSFFEINEVFIDRRKTKVYRARPLSQLDSSGICTLPDALAYVIARPGFVLMTVTNSLDTNFFETRGFKNSQSNLYCPGKAELMSTLLEKKYTIKYMCIHHIRIRKYSDYICSMTSVL